jgi:hypothetical protein
MYYLEVQLPKCILWGEGENPFGFTVKWMEIYSASHLKVALENVGLQKEH